jgi:hypothetical protein
MSVLGLLIVGAWVSGFIAIAIYMRPFGGIPYSWDLMALNYGWVLLLLFGLALAGIALPLLLHRRARAP